MKRTNDDDILRMIDIEKKTKREVSKHFGVSEQHIGQRYKYLKSLDLPESMSKLTEKQQRFAIALSEGKSQTDAAMEAFDCKDRVSAKVLGYKVSKDPDVAIAIQDLLHSEGIGRRYWVKRLKAVIDCADLSVSAKGLDLANRMVGEYQEPTAELNVRALIQYIEFLQEGLDSPKEASEKQRERENVIELKPEN